MSRAAAEAAPAPAPGGRLATASGQTVSDAVTVTAAAGQPDTFHVSIGGGGGGGDEKGSRRRTQPPHHELFLQFRTKLLGKC